MNIIEFGKQKAEKTYIDINWLKTKISNDNEIMLFVWVTKKIETDKDKIIAGHWVSLAGYGKNEQGNIDKNVLIIHDPGSNTEFGKNDFVLLKLVETNLKIDRLNFKNYFELKYYDCFNGGDNIFLAGALCFKIKTY